MDEQKKPSPAIIIGIIIVVIVGIFVWRYFSAKPAIPVAGENGLTTSPAVSLSDTLFIADQKPGRFINARSAVLSKAGFIAVHQEEAEVAGAAIGSGALLPAGQHRNTSVTLNRKSKAGEYFYGMIHHDNGNGIFNPSDDAPAKDKSGKIITVKFKISDTADEPMEYKL